MEVDSVDDAAQWDVVPAGRGHDGLRELAADGFSGGVTDGRVWAMLTNGRVVGVVGGEMADLADADLTAHEAPDPALSLLLAMRERSGEPRAQYYTEETPLREVDEGLRDGGFTGYVELSENVLSGDYYLVYYGGERMSLAFMGGSRRLKAGDEAFDRAAGEVGIYGVYAADISVVDVPGGEDATTVGAVGVGETGADAAAAGVDDTGDAGDDEREPEGRDEDTSEDDEDEPEPESSGAEPAAAEGEDHDAASVGPDVTVASVESEAADREESGDVEEPDDAAADGDVETATPVDDGDEQTGNAAATDGETVEPDDAHEPDAEADPADGDDSARADDSAVAWTTNEDGTEVAATGADDDRLAELRDEREELRERVETLRAERDDLRGEVEDLRAELERVEREREELRERLEPGRGAASDGSLSPATALSGTNLFVRYRSKAEPTLERALDDGTAREAVDENLLLERHTTFETEDATVAGEPYDDFLATTLQYRFVEWLVRAMPFELRDAAGKRPLGRLYKAIPAFDRAEIDGTVTVRTDDGEEGERTFDVVVRDRKGAPLAVASLFDGREPATEAMLSELVEDARAAAAANESLGAAVFVTTSYYAPEALELAEAETKRGGLFGRGSRESYVRLDRSHGFHLCLVEARDDDFHLGVPDL